MAVSPEKLAVGALALQVGLSHNTPPTNHKNPDKGEGREKQAVSEKVENGGKVVS